MSLSRPTIPRRSGFRLDPQPSRGSKTQGQLAKIEAKFYLQRRGNAQIEFHSNLRAASTRVGNSF